MNLIAHIDTAVDASGATFAGGVVVIDGATARAIHEGGYALDGSSTHEAVYDALLRTLEIVEPMGATALDVRLTSQRVVNQVTGVEPVEDDGLAERFERVLGALLRIDTWKIGFDREAPPRTAALAGAALRASADVVELDPESAAERQNREHTGVPQWTAELLEEPGIDCPARCHEAIRYAFGPDVPAGMCVYATRVVLSDGPLGWNDAKQTRMTTVCPHCDVPIQIELVK